MIASLPMYDRPDTRAANDRLWSALRANLPSDWPLPERLTRSTNLWDDWENPDLLFSQTCSLPYRARLRGQVKIVGTPVHDLPCDPGHYFSVIIARKDAGEKSLSDFSALNLAINDPLSQSGWAAPWAMAQKLGLPITAETITGSHQASAQAVAQGQAPLAALDAVTWDMLKRSDPITKDLRVLARSEPTPALPFITGRSQDSKRVFKALRAALAGLSQSDRHLLCLMDVTSLPERAYLDQPIPPSPH